MSPDSESQGVQCAQIAARKPRKLRTAFFVTASLLVLSMIVVFLGVGRWLFAEDPLDKAQAIVVLSGSMPIRAMEAARLYRAGYAGQVWLTHPEEPGAALGALSISYPGEDVFNAQILVHEGVPATVIRVLETPINNTADEIHAISAELRRENASKVIVVTTKAHTRRVRTLWRQLSDRQNHAIIRGAEADPFDPAHWWRTSSDALDVVREILGILNAWAGLPLHPSR
jgi:uncharacterized SAM-binding protein YcdF (DUF218 family)